MKYLTSRRVFLKRASAAVAAVGAARFTALSYAKIAGSNENIRIGVIGFNGRGNAHIDAWRSIKGVDLVALCDADEGVLNKGYARVMKGEPAHQANPAPNAAAPRITKYGDLRNLLDNKDIDAISIATPNHWHSLITVWGCQAGKDVYVEKPVSHDVWEGRQSVAAARKYSRIVQTGTQNRSNSAIHEAIDFLNKGSLGKIILGRALVYNRRGSIGKIVGAPVMPLGINLDLWCGPSPLEVPHREKFHYDWHWFWQTGNGEIGNNAIHEIDIVRWAMDNRELSSSVVSVGGRFGYVDDAETPNTQIAVHRFDDGALMVMEIRGLPSKPGSPKQDTYKGQDVGFVIECENGYLSGPAAYDNKDQLIRNFDGDAAKKSMQQDHFANFIDAVRSRKASDLHADIEQGHLSSALCHTPNISYRLGRKSDPDAIAAALKADPAASEALARFQEHLAKNEINLKLDMATLGMPLKMDPKTESFVDNADANAMLKRVYRAPFVLPDVV